jgi:hypothetical protein
LQRPELPRLEATRMPPHSSRNSVSTCSRPSVSATNCGTTSDSHTSTNGSSRVRHVRGAVDGNAPLCHLRAARSLIPAAAAAAANVLPAIRFLAQSPNLRIRDQPVLREENGQCHTLRGCSRDRPIATTATGKNNYR